MSPQTEPFALTMKQVAEVLHLSRSSVHRIVAIGAIQTYKVGRRRFVTPDEIRAFQARHADVIDQNRIDKARAKVRREHERRSR